ncbi:MAG: hypothetical protein C5S40_01710 [ANME-2 cluster archaeon]|nr:hypothetical protein [ANME-2 cluster archaeon]
MDILFEILKVMNNVPFIVMEGTNEGRGWENIK